VTVNGLQQLLDFALISGRYPRESPITAVVRKLSSTELKLNLSEYHGVLHDPGLKELLWRSSYQILP